jgi:hypothetical protein
MIDVLLENITLKKDEHFTNFSSFRSYILFYLAISIIAAYLSWSCNSKAGLPLSVKLLCSWSAFWLGKFYLIFYVIMYMNYKNELCTI